MKRLILVLIISLGILGILASIIGFFLIDTTLGPSSSSLENCTTLKKTNDGGVNIVIFSPKKEDAMQYANYFVQKKPYNNYKDDFNFYYIGSYSPVCELYKGIALLCYSKDLVKKASSCPNDQIVVLSNDYGTSIRSSNYLNVMSINLKHPLSVFLHEFGHSFVNLAEEYVPATIPRNSAGNCVDDCIKFNGKNDGCYLGCSRSDYSRSIEEGVMRTLSSEQYGSFNEAILTTKVLSIISPTSRITGKAAEDTITIDLAPANYRSDPALPCDVSNYLLIEGQAANGHALITNQTITEGCTGDSGAGAYSYSLILKNDTKIKGGSFDPETIFTDAPPEDTGEVLTSPGNEIEGETYSSDRSFYLKVPLIEDAKAIEIKEPGLAISISIPICNDLKGDANGDGKIDNQDITHITDHLEGNIIYCESNADFNSDGTISLKDASDLSEFLQSSISGFSIKRITGWFLKPIQLISK